MFASLLSPSSHPSPAAPAQVAANPEVSCVCKCVPRGHLGCPWSPSLWSEGQLPGLFHPTLHPLRFPPLRVQECSLLPRDHPPSGLPVPQDMGDHPLCPQGHCPAHVAPTTYFKYAGPPGMRPVFLTVNSSTCHGVPLNAMGINARVPFPLASKMGIQGYTKS